MTVGFRDDFYSLGFCLSMNGGGVPACLVWSR